MKIGLNLLFLKPGVVGGTQTYTESLLKALAVVSRNHEFVLFVNLECRDTFSYLPENFTTVICRIPGRIRPARLLYEQTVLPVLVQRYGIDVLHSLGQTTPLISGCPKIITMHDANYWAMANYFPLLERVIARSFVRQAVFSSDNIIAVSAFTRDELVRWLNVRPGKIAVIHEGCFYDREAALQKAGDHNDTAVLKEYGITGPFLMTVASPWPHKNVAGLIAAYGEMQKSGPAPPLVIVGQSVLNNPAVAREMKLLGTKGEVIFTGYLPLDHLPVLYRNASVFVFPSLYEGFGLPILEAMSFDLPVVSSNRASLPEIGGDAVVLIDPNNPAEFAQQIRNVLDDRELRDKLIERGRKRLKEFSWEKAARKTLELYEKAQA